MENRNIRDFVGNTKDEANDAATTSSHTLMAEKIDTGENAQTGTTTKTTATTTMEMDMDIDVELQLVKTVGEGDGIGLPIKQKRCDKCSKKLGLTGGFPCRCGGTFCGFHRYSDRHDCNFDYREMGAIEIRRNNPLVVAVKLPKF